MAGAPVNIPDAAAENRGVAALAVAVTDEDYQYLQWIFDRNKWGLLQAHDSREAMRFLRSYSLGLAVLLVPGDLPDESWEDLADRMRNLPAPPLLIMITSSTNEQSWMDALSRGAYDVLFRPLDAAEVAHVISLAWLHWTQQTSDGWPRRCKRPGISGTA